MGQLRYRVYFTPLADVDAKTYGTEIDVSDRIEISGIGKIKRTLDSSDYDVGVFVFSDLDLKGFNYNGYFNDELDIRSIFPVTRDRCKVRVVFEDVSITRNSSAIVTTSSTATTITFKGIINEEATRLNIDDESIAFKVLSLDSVLRTTKVSGGIIPNNTLASVAIASILNVPSITSVLNFSALNINPDLDFTIDDGTVFDNQPVKDAINSILLASNSVLLIDSSDNIIVRSRDEDETVSVLNLYGKSDQLGRENIISIVDYNSGRQRTFNSIKINDYETSDDNLISGYGFHQKDITMDFITDPNTERDIANRLLEEFKSPRIELKATVPTSVAKEASLLDRVSINYPLRVKPMAGKFLPIVGVAKIGDALTPLPDTFGSIMIHPNTAFKILEKVEDPRTFLTTLKLRQTNVGVYNAPGNCIVGFAIIDEAIICTGADECEKWNPATIGGAQVGCTMIA